MIAKIVKGMPRFEPVTIELTFETCEELQEFQARMALYRKELWEAINKKHPLTSSARRCDLRTSQMSGITELRRAITAALGNRSLFECE